MPAYETLNRIGGGNREPIKRTKKPVKKVKRSAAFSKLHAMAKG